MRNIHKFFLKKILIVLIALSLTGCWNYVGLNEMVIVSGIAIDKNKDNDLYHLSFEIIDIASSTKMLPIKTKIIESEGTTIFDAVRNAKKRVSDKLYFGNTQIIIVSEDIARNDGLSSMIDWFFRDAETRETMNLIVSEEDTAQELFEVEGNTDMVVSYEIKEIIDEDHEVTASIEDTPFFKIFNTLKSDGVSLVLPVFHRIKTNDKYSIEANGIAIFKDDKLQGFMSPDDAKYYLFAVNRIKGGVLTFCSNEDHKDDITYEIFESDTKRSYQYDNGTIKIMINPSIKVALNEMDDEKLMLHKEDINKLQSITKDIVKERIENVIDEVKTKYNSDIFGFGNLIYKKDPSLWKKLKKDWDKLFKETKVIVDPQITIINTGYMR